MPHECEIGAKFMRNSWETRAEVVSNSRLSKSCEWRMNVRVHASVYVILCEAVCEFQHGTKVHFLSP